MKQGEKAALGVVAAVLVGIAGLTTYLELQRQNQPRSAPQTADIGTGAAALIPAGMNPDDLPEPGSRGASALVTYCVQCHDLPVPTMHSAAEWDTVLTRMEQHIRGRRGMMARVAMPSQQTWNALRQYLGGHAQKPLDTTRLTDLNTPQGQAFQTVCAQCHAAPDPAQHTAREWARVVLRMKSNMTKAGKRVPDDKTAALIVAYLQNHSAQ